MKLRVALCLATAGLAAFVVHRYRGLLVPHAVVVGIAVGALLWIAWRSFDNLRELHRK